MAIGNPLPEKEKIELRGFMPRPCNIVISNFHALLVILLLRSNIHFALL
jgi:hypothetical protein